MSEHYPALNKKFILTLITSIICWTISAVTDQLILTYFSAFFGIIISFVYLLKFFNGILNPFKFLSICSASLFFVTNLTWIITSIFVFIYYKIDLFLFLDNILSIKHEYFLQAIIFTLLFSLVLFFFSLNKKLILKEKYVFHKVQSVIEINNKIIYLIVAGIIILEILLITSGFIEYRTYSQENFKEGIISPWIPYVNYIFHFHISLIALLLYKSKSVKFNIINYFLIIFSLLILGIIFFSRGRFQFFLTYIELTFWFCFFKNSLPKLRSIIIVLIIFLPILYNLTLFNEFLRHTSVDDFENKNILSTIKNNYEVWKFASEKEIITEKTTINFTSRFLSVRPLARILELKPSEKQHLYGKNIFNNLIWVIPRIIFPQKVNYPIDTKLIYDNFGIDFVDTANTVYLFSYLDFWYFGLFLYPLLIFFCWKLLLFLITIKDYNPLIVIFVLANGFVLFFSIAEGSCLGWLSYGRNMSIMLFILAIFSKKKKILESEKSP